MKRIMFFLVTALMLTGCNAQNAEDNSKDKKIEPKVDYKVNKKYDEDGNLIGYDSTYTYYYSNIDQDAMINDSIFKKFNEHFMANDPFKDDKFFEEFFKHDSYMKEDFFKDDFFRSSVESNKKMMDEMMRKMDEMKNQFLIQEYPLKENTNESKEEKK